MSSKIGLLISLMFFALFFLLSVDVIVIQYHYSDLDSQSVVIGYEISRLETLNEENITPIEEKHHVNIENISNRSPEFGDIVFYTISRDYQPLIVSNETMVIKVKRSVVIGYY